MELNIFEVLAQYPDCRFTMSGNPTDTVIISVECGEVKLKKEFSSYHGTTMTKEQIHNFPNYLKDMLEQASKLAKILKEDGTK